MEVIASLPYYRASQTDAQRGLGVFDKSIVALRRLNALGYGREGSGLALNLVYNPTGAFLPPRLSGDGQHSVQAVLAEAQVGAQGRELLQQPGQRRAVRERGMQLRPPQRSGLR